MIIDNLIQSLENMSPLVGEFFSVASQRWAGAATRGLIVLGSLYLIFWKFKRPSMDRHRVQSVGSAKAKPLKEATLTMATYAVYAVAGAIVVLTGKYGGHSMMYSSVADLGWGYTVMSIPIFMFYTDTMFYWSHRLMHENRFFYRAHGTHHQFINVTPWAAYAFHTGEALINAGAFLLLMLVMPWHPIALLVFVLISIAHNGYVHSGFDYAPLSWRTNPLFKWINTPTHHIFHHQKPGYNFGFFFTVWDKAMGTEKLPELTLAHQESRTIRTPIRPYDENPSIAPNRS